MSEQCILVSEPKPGVFECRFNRPHRLNAVIEALYQQLIEALNSLAQNKACRAVILTGEGRAFCVGADLKAHQDVERGAEDKAKYLKLASDACQALYDFPKPVVAAVNGYALGAGAEMALACDFILMQEHAQIGFPEVGIGTFLGGGVTTTLPKRVGIAKAKALVYFAKRVKSEEALKLGLVDSVIASERFIETVYEYTSPLTDVAPLSLALAKEALNSAKEIGQAMHDEEQSILQCMQTKDWQEGIDAFAEKRQPVFVGE